MPKKIADIIGEKRTPPQNFCELLKNWQLALGLSSFEEIQRLLEIEKERVTARDWQDLLIGRAAPDRSLIGILADAYIETTRHLPPTEKVTRSVFRQAAEQVLYEAEHGIVDETATAKRIISVSDDAVRKHLNNLSAYVTNPLQRYESRRAYALSNAQKRVQRELGILVNKDAAKPNEITPQQYIQTILTASHMSGQDTLAFVV